MDITKIRLIGLFTVDFPIVVALPSDPYILKGADGLGPPVVDVSIATSTVQGGTYQGRRPQNREIVLRVGLNPNYKLGQTAAGLRDTLYGMLTPAAADALPVKLMKDDIVVAETTGYVSNIVIVPFSKEPEVQITIPCIEPYFSSPNLVTLVPTSKTGFVIPNNGTAPTGFEMEITFLPSGINWTLNGLGSEKMTFDYIFQNGDKLKFNTNPGQRFIQVTRNNVPINIIHTLTPDSVWLMLRGGNNAFTIFNPVFNWGFVSYKPKYWGL